ncbi:MAG TPA: phage holin family protein [Pyrinomonadaceae bacterium]|nr:phage holin family protein [Pyrinomonadaceae bacterium]
MQQRKDDRSIGELFTELAGDTSTLVRQEVALAKAELTRNAARVGKQVGLLAIGGALGYAALLAIVAAAIMGLAEVIPAWVSALVVGVVFAAIAGWLITKALHALKQTDVAPRVTLETLKEDAQWMKDQVG